MEHMFLLAKNRYEMFLYVTLFLDAILPAFLVVINIKNIPLLNGIFTYVTRVIIRQWNEIANNPAGCSI